MTGNITQAATVNPMQTSQTAFPSDSSTAAGNVAGLFQNLLANAVQQSPLDQLVDLLSGLNSDQLAELLAMFGLNPTTTSQAVSLLTESAAQTTPATLLQTQLLTKTPFSGADLLQVEAKQVADLKQQFLKDFIGLLEQKGISLDNAIKQLKDASTQGATVQDAFAKLMETVKDLPTRNSLHSDNRLVTGFAFPVVEIKQVRKSEAPMLRAFVQIPAELQSANQVAETPKQPALLTLQEQTSAMTQQESGNLSGQTQSQPQSSQSTAPVAATFYPHLVVEKMNPDSTTASATNSSVHVQIRADQFKNEFPAEMIRQASLLERGGLREMKITLVPQGLGEIQVRIQGDSQQVALQFAADNSQVRSLLDASLGSLKAQLEAVGLQVSRVEVVPPAPQTSSASFSMNQGMFDGQNRQRQESNSNQQKQRRFEADPFHVDESLFYQANADLSAGQIDFTA